MSARRLPSTAVVRLALALLLALGVLLALSVALAQATITHEFLPKPSEEITKGVPEGAKVGSEPALTGPFTGLQTMAVESGDLYVAEKVEGTANERLDEFNDSTGAFVAQFPQAPVHEADAGVAIASSGDVYDAGYGGVAVFSNAGTLLGVWRVGPSPSSEDIAVDNASSILDPEDWAAGDVYVVNRAEAAVDVFKPGVHSPEEAPEPAEAARVPLKGTCPLEGETVGGSGCEGAQIVSFTSPRAVAVSQSSGEVLVLDERKSASGPAVDVVDVFKPVKPLALGEFEFVRQLTGTPSGPWEGAPVQSMAVGVGGDIYIAEGSDVDQFSSEGEYEGRLSATPTGPFGNGYVTSVAVDLESGDVYVGERESGAGGGAVDVFGPDIVIPDVATAPVSGFQIERATHTWAVTLNGTVNPIEGAGAATCEFEYGTSTSYGSHAKCSAEVAAGKVAVPVQSESGSVTGLAPDTTYFYRLAATSKSNGRTNRGAGKEDEGSFTTPGPGIPEREEGASAVTAESVTLDATINPHEEPAAPRTHPVSYFFQYGTTSAYGSVSSGATVGPGEAGVVVRQLVQGLSAGTVYHYRAVAVSELAPGEFEEFDGRDRTFTTESFSTFALPDGRQWEMVSPPHKFGALIEKLGARGELLGEALSGAIQAAADGSAFTFIASDPTEAEPQGYDNEVQVLSIRGSDGWSSRDIVAPHAVETGKIFGENIGQEYKFFSEDLSLGVVQPLGGFDPAVSPEASEATPYERSDFSGGGFCPTVAQEAEGVSCYRPLLTGKQPFTDVTSGLPFSTGGTCYKFICTPIFAGATPDARHVLLESGVRLTSEPGDNGGVYEWSAGTNELTHIPIGAGTISEDGSRIVSGDTLFDSVTRETVQLPGEFAGGSSDLSRLFLRAGTDLDECEVVEEAGKLQCRLAGLISGAGGAGVVGVSKDGSAIYFTSTEVLTGPEANGHGEVAQSGQSNLYVHDHGATKLLTVASPENPRVSPDGSWLAFMTAKSLTGYDNRDARTGSLDAEVYLYDLASNTLVCASCDPTGARPLGPSVVPGLTHVAEDAAYYQSRFLSNNGRLFFNSDDALVPQDVDGQEDVYEYEPVGLGSCGSSSVTFSPASDGCIGLISSGTSAEPSSFMDASEEGRDVFFLTSEKLVSQDFDNAPDVYDAQECTSSSPCLPAAATQPPPCATGDSCKPSPAIQPEIFGPSGSATFSGAGNLAPGSGSQLEVNAKPGPTRAQKRTKALKACRKKPKRKRAGCERQARKSSGAKASGAGRARGANSSKRGER
jgi:hypothetical protein